MNVFQTVMNWNLICGKSAPEYRSEEYYKALRNQAERIQEELNELTDALDQRDAALAEGQLTGTIEDKIDEEILDAGCDLDVVVSGLNFLASHDYMGAITAVLQNNDMKYTHKFSVAKDALEHYGDGHEIKSVFTRLNPDENISLDMLKDAGYDVQFQDGVAGVHMYSVHRESDDKICKLLNHPKVDLTPYLAHNLQEEEAVDE